MLGRAPGVIAWDQSGWEPHPTGPKSPDFVGGSTLQLSKRRSTPIFHVSGVLDSLFFDLLFHKSRPVSFAVWKNGDTPITSKGSH